ncbi:MAG: Fic family protein [Erysipelotrichales bacterium]|nr:Fic family protein [Erysipelotrichales bacterium]
MNIAKLLHEQELLITRLNKLLHGSIEIREANEKKYIYVHFREDGILQTKYAGEYSIELYNLILENNKIAKDYKKQLRTIKKELGNVQYESFELNDRIKLNIDFARKNLVESIYKQAKLEGVATTFSDTETIVNGGKVKDMTASDISKVVNLKHAWEFILGEGVITYPTNFVIASQINEIVEEGFSYTAGKLRTVPVRIGGSTYLPPLPFEAKVKEDLENILSATDSYDTAIELLLYVMKNQLFIDGNKRTAVIFANHYLISRGLGLIVIPAELVDDFKKVLIEYYENSDTKIKDFLRNNCLLKLN